MESIKEQFFIEDYSVSQTTLEQVFLHFARAQRPPRDLRNGFGKRCCDCCKFIFGCNGNCCQPNRPLPQPQPQPMEGVMIVQAPPEAERTTAAMLPTHPQAPGIGGYTNVGCVGQKIENPK